MLFLVNFMITYVWIAPYGHIKDHVVKLQSELNYQQCGANSVEICKLKQMIARISCTLLLIAMIHYCFRYEYNITITIGIVDLE